MSESDKVIHLEKLDEYEKIIKEKEKVAVDFFATWCKILNILIYHFNFRWSLQNDFSIFY